MKILTLSMMYPHRPWPHYGVFVKNRMVEVARLVDELTVVAPQPWFPLDHRLFPGKYGHRTAVPAEDVIEGVRVLYPRYLSIPAFVQQIKALDPLTMAVALAGVLIRHPELRDVDIIDTHCAYPEGLAGSVVARLLGKPSVVTLRGHDINDVPDWSSIHRVEVKWALDLVDKVFSVARALADGAIALGTPPDKCVVLSNGVDTSKFHPLDRLACRRKLGLPEEGRIVLAVGYIIRRKGQHLLTEAVGRLRREEGFGDVRVALVGGPGQEPGVMEDIERLMDQYELRGVVHLPGKIRQEELIDWYNAADVMCLASEKEGWANVLLESLACGTPVVATNVWGTPEVITSPDLGVLVDRTVDDIQRGLREALARTWDRDRLVAYAQTHTWEATARRVVEQFREVVGGAHSAAHARAHAQAHAQARAHAHAHVPGDESPGYATEALRAGPAPEHTGE
jgi:glycosyltransferase involved in cell wall biosynthesis